MTREEIRHNRLSTKRMVDPPSDPAIAPSPARLRVARVLARLEVFGAAEYIERVGTYYGVKRIADVLGTGRQAECVRARRALWTLVRDVKHMGFRELGDLFEVDHTAVRIGIVRHRKRGGR